MTHRFSFLKWLCSLLCLILICTLSIHAAASDIQPEMIGGEDSGLINILLVGQDRRDEKIPARADTIILCTFHPESKSVVLTSFLRDLYVQIPGIGGNRLNAAYANGGTALLKQTLRENLNIHIDGCIDVDFSQFAGIIDILGGVTLELRQDEADAINKTVTGTLCEGIQPMNGQQALAYSRIRNLDSDGDFSRTERQRKLLTSLLSSYQDAGLLKILSAIADTLPLISTDLSGKEVLHLAAKLFPLLDNPSIISQRVPVEGSYSYRTIRGMEVLVANPEETYIHLTNTLTNINKTP